MKRTDLSIPIWRSGTESRGSNKIPSRSVRVQWLGGSNHEWDSGQHPAGDSDMSRVPGSPEFGERGKD